MQFEDDHVGAAGEPLPQEARRNNPNVGPVVIERAPDQDRRGIENIGDNSDFHHAPRSLAARRFRAIQGFGETLRTSLHQADDRECGIRPLARAPRIGCFACWTELGKWRRTVQSPLIGQAPLERNRNKEGFLDQRLSVKRGATVRQNCNSREHCSGEDQFRRVSVQAELGGVTGMDRFLKATPVKFESRLHREKEYQKAEKWDETPLRPDALCHAGHRHPLVHVRTRRLRFGCGRRMRSRALDPHLIFQPSVAYIAWQGS